MKKIAIISAIAMSGLFYNAANAQLGIHIGIHLFPNRIFVPRPVVVVQPQEPVYQEPAVSDDSNNDDCDFYYLPDVGAYYSVNDQCYYYQDGDNWVSAAYLPGIYHDFDWRYARRFEIRQPRPYMHNDFYRDRYKGFDRNIARNHDDFSRGFDYRHNNSAYNNDHRFDNDRDNRGGYGQHFDNRGQDNGGQYRNNQADNRFGQQAAQNRDRGNNSNYGRQNDQNQNRDRGNRDNQRVAQNNNGNNRDKRDRF